MRLDLLHGLRVLEQGDSVAVAFCGKILADLGADVLLVEPPGGSSLRRLPPNFEDRPGFSRSILYNWLGANKRSITLDIETERGRAILQELVRRADALVRVPAARPSVTDLHGVNRDLTVVSISPFGADGPYRTCPANDLTLFAVSGFSFYLACPADEPSRVPPKQNPGYQVGLVAGLSAAISSLWGLAAGRRKGRGISVDVSEWEAFTHLLYEHTAQLSDGRLPSDRRRRPGAVLTVVGGLILCLPCCDGWVLASPREDHQFALWGELIEDMAWASEPRFADTLLREQHGWEIYERSAEWTRLRKKAEVCLAAQAKKIACFPVSQMTDLPGMEQLRHRRFWATLEHPMIKGLEYPGLPVRLDRMPGLPSRGAPEPGEHSLEVCEELGPPAAGDPASRGRGDRLSGPSRMYQNVLEGVRVVDFTWVVAGPFCTKLLALMGADVIKVESAKRAQYRDRGAWFSVLNNSKKSCTIDLSTDRGKSVVKRLIAMSDVTVENFSTGVMERLGLGYDALRTLKPDLIYVSSSGVGRTGPGRNWLAYGSLLQGLSGWTSLFSAPNPKMEGMGIAPSWTDPLSGLWEALIIQAALIHRAHTGEGLCVDLSMLESTITMMGDVVLEVASGTRAAGEASPRHAFSVPHGIYPCSGEDSWIAISVGSQSEWARLCQALDEPAWCQEADLLTPEGRRSHRQRVDRLLAEETSRRSAGNLFCRLQSAGVPAVPCYDLPAIVEDPHMQSRGLFQRLPLGGGKEQLTTGLPWREEGAEWKGTLLPAPALGQHNEYVFRHLLGMSAEEYECCRRDGILE